MRRIIMQGVLVLALGGCAIFQPHIHDDGLFKTTYGSSPPGANRTTADPSDLRGAIDDANRQQLRYVEASAEYTALQNATPLVAVPLGVAALLLGITDTGSTGLRLGLGLGAAASLGLAKYYENVPRQRVYVSGAKAIGCVVLAYEPVLQSMFVKNELDVRAERVRARLREVRLLMATEPVVGRDITVAEEAASAALGEAARFAGVLSTAGLSLRERVKSIVFAVDAELVKTNPDLRGISQLIANLVPATQALFPNVGIVPKQDPPKTVSSQDLGEATDRLKLATADLMAFLEDHARPAVQAIQSVANCKVDEAESGLQIFPADVTVSMKPEERRTYAIVGATGVPVVSVYGSYPAGTIVATQRLENNAIVVDLSTVKAPAGTTATLLVDDLRGLGRRQVAITVAAPATSASPAPPSGGTLAAPPTPLTPQGAVPPSPVNALLAGLSPPQLALVRHAIGLGALGATATDAFFTAAEQAKLITFAGQGAVANPQAVLQKARAVGRQSAALVVGPRTPAEIQMSADQVKVLRARCRLPEIEPGTTALFTASLRQSIFDFQDRMGTLPITGLLDPATLENIVGKPCLVPV